MDYGESGPWPVIMADWIDRSLTFWHEHRILTVGFCMTLVVLVHALRRRHTTSQRARRDTSPSTAEKASWNESGVSNRKSTEESPADPLTHTQVVRQSQRPIPPRIVSGRRPDGRSFGRAEARTVAQTLQPLIFYSSLTGTTERLAKDVSARLENGSYTAASLLKPQTYDLSYIDLDDYFISGPKTSSLPYGVRYFYLILVPSYDIDTILNTFVSHLNETHHDFRIDTAPLSGLAGYSVFGVGDKEGWPSEEKGFCSQAVEVDKWMAKLTGRKRAYPLGLGDVKGSLDKSLREWSNGICQTLQDIVVNGSLGEGVIGSGDPVESDLEDAEDEFPDRARNKRQKTAQAADLEDVGGTSIVGQPPLAIDFTTYSKGQPSPPALKAMVPKESPTHAALTKQGYTIVGTHSGVKICRWTKSALRGRGSCYKNSFYGIASHLCMETTPSLSCSNKCVFCWRHGTNPVSTTWRWQVDDPKMIFEGAKEGHYKKIKMMRGVPGVRSDRFEEATRIRHCALSLVGEPIFYPRINEFVDLLHGERISSFLVCNAQHPQQLRDLKRVTQLYVSIDASNRDSLRKIDRPLHRDFWERFQSCLDILREKKSIQRTVFRLTLVKGFNIEDEAEGYADLVQKGLPCFVEIKGVTYCGTSTSASAGLTMQNVPFYGEVVQFVEALNAALERRGLEYGIAAEHEHSCCILLASNRFLIGGKWHTIIDYDRFFELLEGGGDFGPEDYCSPTPEWALWGNGGFDPRDERVDRKGRPKDKPASVNQPVVVESAQPAIDF